MRIRNGLVKGICGMILMSVIATSVYPVVTDGVVTEDNRISTSQVQETDMTGETSILAETLRISEIHRIMSDVWRNNGRYGLKKDRFLRTTLQSVGKFSYNCGSFFDLSKPEDENTELDSTGHLSYLLYESGIDDEPRHLCVARNLSRFQQVKDGELKPGMILSRLSETMSQAYIYIGTTEYDGKLKDYVVGCTVSRTDDGKLITGTQLIPLEKISYNVATDPFAKNTVGVAKVTETTGADKNYDILFVGETVKIEVSKNQIKKGSTVKYSSKDPTVAMVTKKGKVTALSTGKTTITVTVKTGNDSEKVNYYVKVREKTISQMLSDLSTEEIKVQDKLADLRKEYPSGLYWNHVGTGFDVDSDESIDMVTPYPCSSHPNYTVSCNRYLADIATVPGSDPIVSFFSWGYQCSGYAFMISDKLFGTENKLITNYYTDVAQIKVGDYIRYNNDSHSAIVTDIKDDYVVVTDCNGAGEDNPCMISWDKKVKKQKLVDTRFYGFSRY